jgi:hypothetical protein
MPQRRGVQVLLLFIPESQGFRESVRKLLYDHKLFMLFLARDPSL